MGDVLNTYNVTLLRDYMNDKGPAAYSGMGDPADAWELEADGTIDVNELRKRLLDEPAQRARYIQKPRTVSVKGILYPCALMRPGWWESRRKEIEETRWQTGVQQWLFSGFHSWGPSWDFTWDLEPSDGEAQGPSFIAQLGDGDEANSIPVVIPAEKAKRLREKFSERGSEIRLGMSGIVVTVTGVLCHRSHCPEAERRGLIGGILDFCIWLKEGEAGHKISPEKPRPEIYSGYLWKCVAPKGWMPEGKALGLNDVYFIWEHTNFVNESAVKYNLESLAGKESYIRKLHDGTDLVLLQKSSPLVPGVPEWGKQKFYDFFLGKEEDI